MITKKLELQHQANTYWVWVSIKKTHTSPMSFTASVGIYATAELAKSAAQEESDGLAKFSPFDPQPLEWYEDTLASPHWHAMRGEYEWLITRQALHV